MKKISYKFDCYLRFRWYYGYRVYALRLETIYSKWKIPHFNTKLNKLNETIEMLKVKKTL